MKRLGVVLLSLLFAVPVFSQSARDKNYNKLFNVSSAFFVELPKVCKTAACSQIADEGTKVVADGRDKYGRGVLVSTERTTFHKKLDSALLRGVGELQAQTNPLALQPYADLSFARKARCKLVQGIDCTACQDCYDTFEVLAEICALYTIVSPSAALICLGAATIGFGRCVRDNCPTDDSCPT